MPLLDLLNHAPNPNVAIQRSSDGGERAITATALRHIRWDELLSHVSVANAAWEPYAHDAVRSPSAGCACACA